MFLNIILNLIKWAAKLGICNLKDGTITSRRQMMDCHYLLQCGLNCNSSETLSTERWKQLKTKTKEWKSLERFVFEVLNGKRELKGCKPVKDAASQSHLWVTSATLEENGERKYWKYSNNP